MKDLKHKLNTLLSPLDFKVVDLNNKWFGFTRYGTCRLSNNSALVQCFSDSRLLFSSGSELYFESLKTLANNIGNIKFFTFCTLLDPTKKYVSNPYFGCNSLEEALIKKDLISSSI